MSDLGEIHGASWLGPSGEVTLEEGHSHGSSKICSPTKLVKIWSSGSASALWNDGVKSSKRKSHHISSTASCLLHCWIINKKPSDLTKTEDPLVNRHVMFYEALGGRSRAINLQAQLSFSIFNRFKDTWFDRSPLNGWTLKRDRWKWIYDLVVLVHRPETVGWR